MKSIMLFTDLDGTFIDFETYSASVAAPAARSLLARDIPVIFCSSKTQSEQVALMEAAGFRCPGIVENGSGFFIPQSFPLLAPPQGWANHQHDWIQAMGVERSVISPAIKEAQRELSLDLKPYANLTAAELADLTGLSHEAAARAKDRRFSQTLTAELTADQLNALNEVLQRHRLHAICGGRFHTVASSACDKGKALQQLVAMRAEQTGQPVVSVAIGDSANDVPMLLAADRAYLVQRPDGKWNDIDLPGLIKVPAPGPHGSSSRMISASCSSLAPARSMILPPVVTMPGASRLLPGKYPIG